MIRPQWLLELETFGVHNYTSSLAGQPHMPSMHAQGKSRIQGLGTFKHFS